MEQITISAVSGTYPFNILICDVTLDKCETLATNVLSFPQTYTLTGTFENFNTVLIKIIDSNGCDYFEIFECPVTPTPTPSITPTLTPTTTPGCHCIEFKNTGTTIQSISFIECNGSLFGGEVNTGTTLYYCGSNPIVNQNILFPSVVVSIYGVCGDTFCSPSSTPSQTLTPTPTVTPSSTQ